ncbi:uncharacterized protein TRUGW13939_00040 [Talaromyces rugulosus]|uniref:Zn(2)-C6 fungal-type domain-containing protein n=1 Tax=Talaromyces rugulosus TaxID=121627 RepID=A0A7H8QGF7_TALRU|nr:uncharacterized protein TRUGW13939_00040 [Talaromyces rugulosus]QKX52969.1 hypothetical protein TRUGW13939_00040 [Talaromyces rugulosus]
MSAVYAPNPPARPARRSTAPTAPKLRDTCDACAASKVKCNKEKPTCARCAKRGVVCEYVVTKRSGRKHERRQSDARTTPQASSSSTTNTLSQLADFQPPPRLRVIGDDLDNSPNMLSSGDQTLLWIPNDLSPEFNELFNFPITSQTTEGPKSSQALHYSQIGTEGINIPPNSDGTATINPNHVPVTMDDVSESPALSIPRSLSESRSTGLNDALTFEDPRSDASCCCLLQALDLLKRSLRISPTLCMCSRGQESSPSNHQLRTVQSVFEENEEAISTITNMLQCPCSRDGYLLAIVELTVFKILGLYAAAAKPTSEEELTDEIQKRCSPSCHFERVVQRPDIGNSYYLGDGDHGRIIAQQVLSKLYHVQTLVSELSSRLKAVNSHDEIHAVEFFSPFSPAMLNQLDINLRTRLRALYLEIVDLATRIVS